MHAHAQRWAAGSPRQKGRWPLQAPGGVAALCAAALFSCGPEVPADSTPVPTAGERARLHFCFGFERCDRAVDAPLVAGARVTLYATERPQTPKLAGRSTAPAVATITPRPAIFCRGLTSFDVAVFISATRTRQALIDGCHAQGGLPTAFDAFDMVGKKAGRLHLALEEVGTSRVYERLPLSVEAAASLVVVSRETGDAVDRIDARPTERLSFAVSAQSADGRRLAGSSNIRAAIVDRGVATLVPQRSLEGIHGSPKALRIVGVRAGETVLAISVGSVTRRLSVRVSP